MEDPAVGGGCAHHFCASCYIEWASRRPSCPTCRAPVWTITKDAEFAKAIGAKCSLSTKMGEPGARAEEGAARVHIKLPAPAGLTIANSASSGCVVTRVVRGNGGDVAGIRAGDVILAVNGTVVRDHRQCVEFIEKRCRVGDCEVSLKPRSAATEAVDHLRGTLYHGLRGLASPFERSRGRGRRLVRDLSRPVGDDDDDLASDDTGDDEPDEQRPDSADHSPDDDNPAAA